MANSHDLSRIGSDNQNSVGAFRHSIISLLLRSELEAD
ncbi:MAG: hypothetical protein JWM11_1115 [Planctomycetaceae bacterium]|nr:hypothetical protein [Planctomycetaceae bacterium]